MKSTEYQLNAFVKYIRTLQFVKHSTQKNKSIDEPVYVSTKEIKERFLVNPEKDMANLVQRGDISILETKGSKGFNIKKYNAEKGGYYDFGLLRPKGRELNETTRQMMGNLRFVSLPENCESTPYFDVFLRLRNQHLRIFFTSDNFSGRVHTPITSLKSIIRKQILLAGQPTTAIDVVTMQPLILGKILKDNIGVNDFSNWIDEGKDIYSILQEKLKLEDRKDAKKKFFEIVFAPANENLTKLFGDANWIQWVNQYKSKVLHTNPRSEKKPHSNLAWLLQSKEVEVMSEIWKMLTNKKIKFLSVHDEIIVNVDNYIEAENYFNSVMNRHFTYHKISSKN